MLGLVSEIVVVFLEELKLFGEIQQIVIWLVHLYYL